MKKQKVYIANCIEHGDRFVSYFKTATTDRSKIKELGREMATTWGGECTSIKEWVPETIIKIKDTTTGKIQEITEKKWDRFNDSIVRLQNKATGKITEASAKKYLAWVTANRKQNQALYEIVGTGTTRYVEVERSQEKEPDDVYDCDNPEANILVQALDIHKEAKELAVTQKIARLCAEAKRITESVGQGEWQKDAEEFDKKLHAFDESLGAGLKIGRLVKTPVADGKALYFVIGLNKTTVKLQHIDYMDGYTSPAVAKNGCAPRYFAEDCVAHSDACRKIFNAVCKGD